ncbi:hypothetical protein HPP92_007972 [Vanilla planifolia]|uniref:RNA-dependent RNA polymerase n=1 Tax=Vanilla planifolia TaxID=51239 RepID=A0A835VAK0_VANPL|nr:hypothetical protein HPP92_007972 [Vanilla planifolia]
MLNAVLHKGIFNQHHLNDDFFKLLRAQNDGLNDAALKHIWAYKRPIFDACQRLKLVHDWLKRNLKIAAGPKAVDGNMEVRRRYSFLAFSSNQLRDKSAWFFADDGKTTSASIRKWMGKFHNKNAAKCAARMGLCFSSTHATVKTLLGEVNFEMEDIVRNDHVFSDGIGKITPDLGMEVSERLQLDDPPSAYQIRYAGYKGVIAVWPGKGDGVRLSLRKSMYKFSSSHSVLEIISWTRFQPGFLNRQIITLLSALGVPDMVFWRMQEEMVSKLDHILIDTNVALEVLTTSCAEQGNTAALMLTAGFKPQTEPHLKDMLLCVRASQLRDLLSKARIFVPKRKMANGLPGRTRDIGTRSVLYPVDTPELHHLVDCLVFPQKGERPHANEASGSDLDGDLYFVSWEPDLIPPSKKSWIPLDYKPAESKSQPRDVTHHDIIDFFVRSMVSENVGVICNAHVVHADLSEFGAMDERCIQLAELAAIAVDFPKTGMKAEMPQSLKPKLYPDFMEKHEHQSYKSEKILGKLYRAIRDAATESSLQPDSTSSHKDIPYDKDLEVPGASDFLAAAWEDKCIYDSHVNALMGHYRIRAEAEVVTGEISSLPKCNSRKQGELKERIRKAYAGLRGEFRAVFEAVEPNGGLLSDEEKNLLLEFKASAWYQVTYHPDWMKRAQELSLPDVAEVSPRLSFAWIAADYLAGIKMKRRR